MRHDGKTPFEQTQVFGIQSTIDFTHQGSGEKERQSTRIEAAKLALEQARKLLASG